MVSGKAVGSSGLEVCSSVISAEGSQCSNTILRFNRLFPLFTSPSARSVRASQSLDRL